MSLTETFALLAVIISLLVLLVDAVHVTFEITWKISHEDREHNTSLPSPTDGSGKGFC